MRTAIKITYGGYALLCGSIFLIIAIPAIATSHTIKHPITAFTSLSYLLFLFCHVFCLGMTFHIFHLLSSFSFTLRVSGCTIYSVCGFHPVCFVSGFVKSLCLIPSSSSLRMISEYEHIQNWSVFLNSITLFSISLLTLKDIRFILAIFNSSFLVHQ